MVALRRIPRDLPAPLDDGLPMRPVHAYSFEKAFYWGGIVNGAARATKKSFSGRRTCLDLFAAHGINRDEETGELSWGSALLAMHADDPFDLCIFGDLEAEATKTLGIRVEDLFSTAAVFPLTLGEETIGAEIARIKKAAVGGTKVVTITGDANEMPPVIRLLLPAFEGVRYSLAMIDPPSACFDWDSLAVLTLQERMDLVMLFPEDMDIERNLRSYLNSAPGSKLDRYFPGRGKWRRIAADPSIARRGLALRELYKQGLEKELGYVEIAHRDRAIRNRAGLEIYKLLFASKHKRGREIWDSASKHDPSGQMEFFFR